MDLESSFELIERAKQGDTDALNRLLARYLPRVRRWASGRLPPPARDLGDTNDVVQEALIGTFRRICEVRRSRRRGPARVSRQAVMNRIRDEMRKVERRPPHDLLDTAIPGNGISPLEAAIGQQAIERVRAGPRAARGARTPGRRGAAGPGQSYEEIAALVNKPTAGAARVAISRAVAKLARLMAQP